MRNWCTESISAESDASEVQKSLSKVQKIFQKSTTNSCIQNLKNCWYCDKKTKANFSYLIKIKYLMFPHTVCVYIDIYGLFKWLAEQKVVSKNSHRFCVKQ